MFYFRPYLFYFFLILFKKKAVSLTFFLWVLFCRFIFVRSLNIIHSKLNLNIKSMSYFEMYPYRYLFKFIPRFDKQVVSLCYYGCCYGWSSAFYCNSLHQLCPVAHYSIWQLMHGLPSYSFQLSLF